MPYCALLFLPSPRYKPTTKICMVTNEMLKMKLTLTKIILLFLLSHVHSFAEQRFNEEEEVERSQFPSGFLFGTATSSYQIEGAVLEDGKGANNWDFFCRIPGSIKNGDTGDIADDHYHRFLEDIELMHSLGVNAYRFSISWSRILPKGMLGEVNPKGVIFYNKIIENLLLKGIEPHVTIYHHDHPQELEERFGAWLSPLMQEEFVHFAETCFQHFGDRVKYWTTINEPNLFSILAYLIGIYPPAHCSAPFGNCSNGNSDTEPLISVHNMLISHAKAANIYRHNYQLKQGGMIGIVAHVFMYEPLRDIELDHEAAKRKLAFTTAWVLDPLVFGDYPPEMRQYHGDELPRFTSEETKLVTQSLDFIGINHYTTLYAKDCVHSPCGADGDQAIQGFVCVTGERHGVPIGERTGMDTFFIVPKGMEKTIEYVKERYNMPMFVTENGYSPPVKQNEEEEEDLLHDFKRIEFLKAYLASVARAIRNGADVRGYFIWSLMDNMEWVEGYTIRFGLYHVQRENLRRTPKLSARWYAEFLNNSKHHLSEDVNPGSFKLKDSMLLNRLKTKPRQTADM